MQKLLILLWRFRAKFQTTIRAMWAIGIKEVFIPIFVRYFTFIVLSLTLAELFINVLLTDLIDKPSIMKQINEMHVSSFFLVYILIFIINCIYSYFKKLNSFYLHESDLSKNQLSDKYKLSIKSIDNGYEIYDFINSKNYCERYIMSHDVNTYLLDGQIKFSIMSKYILSTVLIKFLPHLINQRLKTRSSVIFDGKLLGIVDDILLNTKDVRLRKVKFFDSLCTHEMVYKKVYVMDSLETYYDGVNLLYNKENETIHDISSCLCTNHLGASTILITQENGKNHFWFTVQGKGSDFNAQRIAPTGSGSVDFKDTKKKRHLHEVLTYAMERELTEELAIDYKNKVNTKLIGYARLLERGGKPDFFGISYFSGNIKNNAQLRLLERYFIENFDKVEFQNYLTLPEDIENFCSIRSTSIQVHIIVQILKNLREQNPEKYKALFEELAYEF